ncbi:hypothetical protein L914_12845 [Phytophthora nicotianae]|uniref:MULE transposase domain-containing protein n=1 Tax=Phytophthora nicotianae TaxID=4792 RepID=W2N102_PHYNI|nr:hypothetical protein L914_12845 [Phytophthora nicotianae]
MLLGRGPKKCRKILQERNAVPDATQPKNLKAHLKSSLANGWEIKNIVKFLEWVFPRMCSSRAFSVMVETCWLGDFDAAYDAQTFCKNSRDFRHEFLVLECFEHAITTENGTKDSCFGLVVKSDKFSGTYSTLIMVNAAMASSVSRTEPTGSITYSKTFPPWVYVFVRAEHQLAYGSLDRMAGIANAFAEVWPEITLLNCYPHFNQKRRENRNCLKDSEFYQTNVLLSIQYLAEALSRKQNNALGKLIFDYWREKGEGDYSDWMQQYYMASTWGNWFYTAAVPGLTPSQNAIESHYKLIKKPTSICVVQVLLSF